MTAISVIIPIYNVEIFLARCLESVIHQTFKNIEIICVNDCSPDNCIEILKEYAQKDNRIRIINRERNGGLSAARITGLENAKGEYIYFLDSDDWIKEDFLGKMYCAITKNNQQAVCCTNVLYAYADGSIKKFLHRDFNEEFISYSKSCIMAWSWLLKKSFLNKFSIIFPIGCIHEDLYFFYVLIRSLGRVYAINNTAYYHYENPTSIMGCVKGRVIKDFDSIRVNNLIYEYYKQNQKISKWGVPFFYLPKYCLKNHEDKEKFFNLLKQFFIKISEDVFKYQNLYSQLELNFFYEILDSKDYESYKSKNTSIIGALRNNVIRSNVKTSEFKKNN